MKFEYVYTVTMEQARQRIEALGEYLANRHKIAVTWDGDRAILNGRFKKIVKIRGVLSLADGVVLFDGEDPGIAWRGQATKYIQRKLTAYLDASTPLEELPRC